MTICDMGIDTQNSWYISKPLSDCPNLLSKQEEGNYKAHFYHCQCGLMEVILSSKTETPSYQCEECDNKYFIDTLKVNNDDIFYKHKENLNFIYECRKTDDGYITNVFLPIPYQADFINKKLLYKKEFIANLIVSFSKRRHIFNLPLTNFKGKELLKNKMCQFIIENTGDKLVYYKDSLKTQEGIYPFFFEPNLIDAEFYFWYKIDLRALDNPKNPIGVLDMLHYLLNHRKERSIKRTLFEKYKKLLKHKPYLHTFNTLAPFVISRCFNDPNIASKLLAEDLAIFSLEEKISIENPSDGLLAYSDFINFQIWFIKFLKIHYTENQLAKMFLEQCDDVWRLWSDTLSMVGGNQRAIKKGFEKVKLTFKNIHDEIIRCTNTQENKELKKMHFSYEKNYEKACITLGDMEFRLPSTGRELGAWADDMHNCISGYGLSIRSRKTTIYGAFRDDKMLYTIEASPSEISEMSGKDNSEIPTSDTNIINQWWEKHLYEKW